MKITNVIVTLLAFSLVFPGSIHSQDTILPDKEIYQQKTIDKQSGLLRSRLTGTFKKISEDRYLLQESGKGNYDKFQDVAWTLKSETELRENLLCPLYTIFTVIDKGARQISTCKKEYDYEKKIIRITQKDANNEITKAFSLPLKTHTTDYATLIYFLRPFMKDLMAEKIIRFHFMSCEPKLYKLKARFISKETIMVGSQNIETVKVAVAPDMGPLNVLLDRLVPPTLLWYGKKYPHPWLQYEGLESGRQSAYILTTVEEIAPLLSLLPLKSNKP
ncbi:hypothetical protein ACFL1E_06000 [Candidatus Omnitrophota bacterium]